MANLELCDTHNMVAYLLKPEGSEDFQQIQTASTSILEDREVEITATIDGQLKTITEASLRRHLKLEDADGISSLPNSEIFEQLALMGLKKTAWERFSSNIAIAIICLATNKTFNFSKMIFEGMVKKLDSRSKFLMYPRFIQIVLNKHQRLLLPHKRTYVAPTLTQKLFNNMRRVSKGYTGVNIPLFSSMLVQGPIQQGEGSTVLVESHHIHITSLSTLQPPLSSPSRVPTPPHDSPLLGGHTPGSDECSMTLYELTVLCIQLLIKVASLEKNLQHTKKVYSDAYTKLIMKVKKLEHKVKSRQPRRRARVVISNIEEDLEDPSKQGRRIAEIDQNLSISLPTELVGDLGSGEKGEKEISTTNISVSTASATPEVSTAAENLVYIRRSAEKRKDKGKAIMKEDESVQMKTKKQLEQERLGHEEAIRLQEQFNEEERQRIARDAEIAKQLQEEFQNRSFSKAEDQNQYFVPKDSEIEKVVMKRPGFDFQQKSSKKRSREDFDEDNAKKQKLEDDAEKKELRDSMDVVPRDDIAIDIESLATKYPIHDWKTHVLTEIMMYYQIIRGDGSSKNYKIFSEMLDDFDRQDVLDLHRLILFEPNEDDEIWKNQQDYNLISWRLFDSCGIHMLLMHTTIAIHMMIEKKYPLTQEMLSRMLSKRLEVDQESEMAFELLRIDAATKD
ncbi:hypothetical protein Tco_1311407 [Tanacetum coccineum]